MLRHNMLKDVDSHREYITTSQAAERAELSRVYLAQLLRKGTLDGFQFGRDWFVYVDSLEQFLQQKRKPGPKGPRMKSPLVEQKGTICAPGKDNS